MSNIIELFTAFWIQFFPEQQTMSRQSALRACKDTTAGMFAYGQAPETHAEYQDAVSRVYGSYEDRQYHIGTFSRVWDIVGGGQYKNLISIGCGPASIELFLVHMGVVEKAMLVDMSPGMIARAQEIAEELQVSDCVEFIVARGEEVQIEKGVYDVGFTINSMHWSKEWGKWIDALHKGLALNSVVFVGVSLLHPQSGIEEEVLKRFMSRRFKVQTSDWMFPDMKNKHGQPVRSTRYRVVGRKKPIQAAQKPKGSSAKKKKKRKR